MGHPYENSEYVFLKIGSGAVVHVAVKSVRESDGAVTYWTICGSDHQTNRGTGRKRMVQGPFKCSKCLKIWEKETQDV